MLNSEVFRGVHTLDEVKPKSFVSLLTSEYRRLVSVGSIKE